MQHISPISTIYDIYRGIYQANQNITCSQCGHRFENNLNLHPGVQSAHVRARAADPRDQDFVPGQEVCGKRRADLQGVHKAHGKERHGEISKRRPHALRVLEKFRGVCEAKRQLTRLRGRFFVVVRWNSMANISDNYG